ncbi:MAG: hypothetical protein R2698_13395 [Microthrixaceae bacterium]
MGRCGVVTGEHRHRQGHGNREPGPLGALVQALHPGLQHVDTAGGVQRQVLDAQRSQHPGRSMDRRGDVEQLEVEEHLIAEVAEVGDHVGAGGAEEFEAHLGDAEPRSHPGGQAVRLDQVVRVQDQREPSPDRVGDLVRVGRARRGVIAHVRLQ